MRRAARNSISDAFAGRTVLVTGAGGGIGRHVVQILHDSGAEVIASDVSDQAILGLPGRHVPMDVTDQESVTRSVASIEDLDGLVLAHGITALGRADEVPMDAVERVVAVNLVGSARVTRATLAGLLRRRGRISVLSSVAGFGPLVHRSAYSASKHGVHGYFDSLRAECAREGLGVTVVAPGFVATDIGQHAAFASPSEAQHRTTTGAQLGPEHVATAILEGMARRRRLVLVGRTARQARLLHRVAPAAYERVMARRVLRA